MIVIVSVIVVLTHVSNRRRKMRRYRDWAGLGWLDQTQSKAIFTLLDWARLGWAGPRTAGGDIHVTRLSWAGLDQERPEAIFMLLGWTGLAIVIVIRHRYR